MSISFESITFPSSLKPGTDREATSAHQELRRQLQTHRPLPPPSQLFFLTEYSRMDGMWRLTNAPRADSADVPSIGEALARASERKIQPPKVFVTLDDCPILHAKAREALAARDACAGTGIGISAVPFPVKAVRWRHPSPDPSLAWHCRRGVVGAETAAPQNGGSGRDSLGKDDAQETGGTQKTGATMNRDELGGTEARGDARADEESAERARISKLLWRTEASASWGSVLPTDLHFPARFHPTRREFSESFPLQRERRSGLCTSIKRSRLPRGLEPLGGV